MGTLKYTRAYTKGTIGLMQIAVVHSWSTTTLTFPISLKELNCLEVLVERTNANFLHPSWWLASPSEPKLSEL